MRCLCIREEKEGHLEKLWLRLTGGVLALILFAGCASTPEPAPAEGPWTPSELSFALSGNDPVEGFNRSMFAVTDFGMEYVVDPLGRVYTSILPRPAIEKSTISALNWNFPPGVQRLGLGRVRGGVG